MEQVVKDLIVDRVRGFFNDRSRGERPVERSDDAILGPRSIAWRVHGDVMTMMVGGVAALLLQMLQPSVLAGVWDHSNFRRDMHGRLRRTARFIAVTTYGERAQAEAAIARVRAVHARVRGTVPGGRSYTADDPELLAWVHVTETFAFLEAWRRYAQPTMPVAEQDRYFAEMGEVARRLGAAAVPASRRATLDHIEHMRPCLQADRRTREVVDLILRPPVSSIAMLPLRQLAAQAAIDLLPRWARTMHGLPGSGLGRPMIVGGTAGTAGLIRWAFR